MRPSPARTFSIIIIYKKCSHHDSLIHSPQLPLVIRILRERVPHVSRVLDKALRSNQELLQIAIFDLLIIHFLRIQKSSVEYIDLVKYKNNRTNSKIHQTHSSSFLEEVDLLLGLE